MDIFSKESTYDRKTSYEIKYSHAQLIQSSNDRKLNEKSQNQKHSKSSERFSYSILAALLIPLSVVFYLFSLIGCDDSTVICLKTLSLKIKINC